MSEKNARVYDIVCSRCGAHDYVSFRPRPGSTVMCRTCFEKNRQDEPRAEKGRHDAPHRASGRPGHPQDRRPQGGAPRRPDNRRPDDRRPDSRRPDDRRPDNRRSNDRRPDARRPDAPPARTWSITCPSCGAADEVPFEPRPGSAVMCRPCFEANKPPRPEPNRRQHGQEREERPPRPQPPAPSIPRLEHGTRVYYPITCQKCGKGEVLSYVPKVNGELLCTGCASERYGRTWYQVKLDAEDERREHEFECATCGRMDALPFKPQAGRKYHCGRCMEDQALPNKGRLEGFEEVEDPESVGLRVRRG